MLVITVYTIFVLFWLIHEGFGFKVDDTIMSSIDNVFLNFFLLEIILKSFASNLMYLYDLFNFFDTFVVILSYVLNQMEVVIKGVSVLRLIRVVVIILRKITGNQNKLRHQNKNLNPVESIIKILE
jgi:signal transduction histidine kinase